MRHFPAFTAVEDDRRGLRRRHGRHRLEALADHLHHPADVVVAHRVDRHAALAHLHSRLGEVVGGHVVRLGTTEHPAAVDDDVGADVAGHHDRDLDVRRVDPEVLDERLGEALHRELGRAVGGVRDAGPSEAQKPFTLLVLTR